MARNIDEILLESGKMMYKNFRGFCLGTIRSDGYILSAIAFRLTRPSTARASPLSASFLQMAQFPASSSNFGSKDSITRGPSYPISWTAWKNSLKGTRPVPGIPRSFSFTWMYPRYSFPQVSTAPRKLFSSRIIWKQSR